MKGPLDYVPTSVEEGSVYGGSRQRTICVFTTTRMGDEKLESVNETAKENGDDLSYSYSGKKPFDGGGKRPAIEADFSMTGDGGSSSAYE